MVSDQSSECSSIETISVLGFSYLQPIADLLDKLLSIPSLSACGQKPSANEVGYSAAVIVLFVALLESFVTRVQFFLICMTWRASFLSLENRSTWAS